MNKKYAIRIARWAAAVLVVGYFFPLLTIFLIVCGLIDLSRHKVWSASLFARYFAGNGIVTWLLSPLNLLLDLISKRLPYELRPADFPEPARKEIEDMLGTFEAKKPEILAELRSLMGNKRRGMLFYKWYGKNIHASVPAFNKEYTYIKTIGVSVFNARESTSVHFGPLRLTIRLLYNLSPKRSDNVFIEVNGKKHFWHDDPLFIFDDTIQHRSVNEEDGERFCVFVDVLRPSRFPALQNAIVALFAFVMSGVNRIFYKNWDMLGGQKQPA
ncbi:MAG: aspartyl/asparaginyl beta-hydroxylase domain-containing protein [Beijerinckiaceae bacterium]